MQLLSHAHVIWKPACNIFMYLDLLVWIAANNVGGTQQQRNKYH